jgi:hypothetical protein
MLDWIERAAIYLWYYLDIQIRQIVPYWALGILLGSAVSVFGKKYIQGAFAKIGQRKMGWLGVIPASLLGIASPLCMYGTIPIAASFSEQGVKDDYLAAFMMSSILLNPQLIFYSGALGRTALIIQCVSCFLCGKGGSLGGVHSWRLQARGLTGRRAPGVGAPGDRSRLGVPTPVPTPGRHDKLIVTPFPSPCGAPGSTQPVQETDTRGETRFLS